MSYQPANIVNRSLRAIGSPVAVGNIESDGTDVSEAAREAYGQELRALLRAAFWSCARKRARLTLLGDSTGQTPNVGTIVESPWIYAYAWPNDAVAARWLPWNGEPPSVLALAGGPPIPGNIQPPNPAVPIMTGLNQPQTPLYPWERPARFLLSTTDQYPQPGPQEPNFDATEGVGFVNRRIILTNVPHAHFVYTYVASEIETWDELFTKAMVAVMASVLAPIAWRNDPKRGVEERNAQIAIAKQAIKEARVASANEAGFRQSTDHMASWIRVRRLGGFGRWGAGGFNGFGDGGGPGVFGYGWDSFGFGDGSVY